jgi:hypothetical protein
VAIGGSDKPFFACLLGLAFTIFSREGVFMFYFSSARRLLRHSAFSLLAVFCLSTALLFTGCSSDDDDDDFIDDHKLNQNLIGKWMDAGAGDSYTITTAELSYNSGFGGDYAGTIKYVSNFTSTAGVIIIEYDADHKPKYYAGYDPDTYEPIGDPLPLKGNFIGIYYKDFKPGVSVQMGVAYTDGGAEKATLDAAKAVFIVGNEGTYMTYYGTYLKQ